MTNRKVDMLAAELASGQHGALARKQLLPQLGDDKVLDRRLAAGLWKRLVSGVYAPASAVPTWRHELSAALLAHPGAVVSHSAAAALHRWSGYGEGPVEISGSYRANTRSLGVVHRTKDLADGDITEVDGLVVTTVLRTAIDMSSVLRRRRLEWLLDDL